MLSHTDRNGKVWSYTYSGSNLASEKDPLSNATSYSYTSTSETTTNALGKTATDNYSSGLLSSHVDQAGYSTSFSWSSGNDLLSKTDELGLVWSQTWDSNGNCLTQMHNRAQSGHEWRDIRTPVAE